MASDKPGFFAELKHRNVWRAAVLYAGAAWALSQGVAQLGPAFGMPEWGTRWFVIACIIAFPFWLAFAWFYELTPHGFKREDATTVDTASRHSNARKLDFAIIGVMAVAIALLASGYFIHRNAPAAAIPAKSIAVLPFANLSSDKQNAYFVAGMQDLILTKLADISDLKVIARTSTQGYGSHPQNLSQVGRELGVATLLEGSVQKAGNEVLVNVQLIDAKTDAHIWAQSYTRTLTNVFGVEGEVAGKVAAALNAKLSPAESANLASDLSTNNAANDLFLRAEYRYHRVSVNGELADLKAAISLYQQAVKADPGFALAWARLSIAEGVLAGAGLVSEDSAQLHQQARTDAEQALKQQPGLPVARLAMAYCDLARGDQAAGLAALEAVLAQRPNDVEALKAQANVRYGQGQFDAAIALYSKAVALDPRNFTTTLDLGTAYMAASRYVDAQTWYQRALALEPDSVNAKTSYANAILFGSGDVTRALAVLQGDTPGLKLERAWKMPYQRKTREAIALLEGIPDTPGNEVFGYSRNIQLAVLYQMAGDRAKARPFFAKGLAKDRPGLAKARGIYRANLLCTAGGEEIATGHTSAGMAMIAQSDAMLDKLHDTGLGPSVRLCVADVYAMAERADLAVPVLTKALTEPGIATRYSPLMLWLDPMWDPIRKDPGFQALLKKYAKYKPAVIYPIPSTSAAAASSG